MSTEKNVHSNDTTDEQFKYVKLGPPSNRRSDEKSGAGTIIMLIVALVVCMAFYKVAQQLSAHNEARSTTVPTVVIAAMPYIGATLVVFTSLVAIAFLFIAMMCIRPLIQSDLSWRGVMFVLCVFMVLLGLSIATVMYLWWFYTA